MITGTTKTASRGAFVLLAMGCGGRAEYLVGAGAGAGVGGGVTAGGSPSLAVAGSSAAGSPRVDVGGVAGSSAGGAMPSIGGGAGADNGELGGAVGVAGAPVAAYCGEMLPAPTRAVAFAPTTVVWNRIQSFLGTAAEIPPGVPAVSTPQLAGALADFALGSLKGAPAPGLARFVGAWWPGTPNSDAWATLFVDPKATLADLLTTNIVLNPGSGVLTDPAVLKLNEISMRGAFITEHLLCNSPLPPSPAGVPPLGPAQPGQTRRQQLEQAIAAPSCAACHARVDPIGDSLEHYDAAGMFKELDNGSPIDSSGTMSFTSPGAAELLTFADVNELGEELAGQCGVSWCLTQALLAHAETSAKLPVAGSTDPQAVAQIANASASGKLRDLIRNVVESDTFLRAK